MTTRISKTPARVATVTNVGYKVNVTGGDGGRAPISIEADNNEHAGRLAAALRGFLADAYVAGRIEATDAMKRLIAEVNE